MIMAAKIKASVGRKGKNLPEDVKTVQNLLNGFASKFGLPKLKTDGVPDAKLEQAIGKFQQEVCEMRADYRVDPGRNAMKKLVAGPAKAEAERKAKEKAFYETIRKEMDRARAEIETSAAQMLKKAGLPVNLAHDFAMSATAPPFNHVFIWASNLKPGDLTPEQIKQNANASVKDAKRTIETFVADAVRKRDEVRAKIAEERDRLLKAVRDEVRKKAKEFGMPVDKIEQTYAEVEKTVEASIKKIFPGEKDILDYTPKDIAKLGQQVLKEGSNHVKLVIGNAVKVRQMVLKTIASQRNSTLNKLKKVAEAQAKKAGLPLKSVEMLYGKYEKIAKEQFDKFTEDETELFGMDVKDVTDFASKVMGEVEGGMKAIADEAAKKRSSVEKDLIKQIKAKANAMKLAANQVDEIIGDIGNFAEDQWDWLMGRSSGGDVKDIGKMAGDVAKEAGSHMSDLLKEAEKRQREGESGEDAKTPILLRGSEEGIKQGGFSFKVSGKSPDPKSKVLLIVGKPSLQLDITKGFSKTQMVELFKLIDQGNLWSSIIDFYAIETTDGKPDKRTKSKTLSLRAPVAPFKGTVSLKGLGADKGMIYTGNGKGRYLYTTPINGWYFLKYGPNFERDPKMRGFDCITYVGSANKTMAGMSGRGDGLASHLGAKKVNMEGVSKEDIVEFFKGDGKSGTYIAWWKTHCIAVVNGVVHEFSQSKGGFNSKAAASYGWPKTGNYARKL